MKFIDELRATTAKVNTPRIANALETLRKTMTEAANKGESSIKIEISRDIVVPVAVQLRGEGFKITYLDPNPPITAATLELHLSWR